MMLGLVLHSALTYNVTYPGDAWSLKDPETTHIFSDSLVFLIHSFRMPIFFLVAGFFGAMLFYERGRLRMIKNRISRIVFPFTVFLFLLWPITIFAFGYTNAIFSHQENPFEMAMEPFTDISAFLPRTTSHLWFLYYLSLITGTIAILGILLKNTQKLTKKITKIFDWLIQRPFARIIFFFWAGVSDIDHFGNIDGRGFGFIDSRFGNIHLLFHFLFDRLGTVQIKTSFGQFCPLRLDLHDFSGRFGNNSRIDNSKLGTRTECQFWNIDSFTVRSWSVCSCSGLLDFLFAMAVTIP